MGAVVAGLLVLGVAWGVWTAVSVANDLEDVDRNARILRASLVRGDAEGARDALASYQRAAEDAADGTTGPTWAVLAALPALGDDAEGVRTVAGVLADLGRDGLPPLVDAADDVTAKSFHPADGTFPLQRIASLERPAAASERAFADAENELAAVHPGGFVSPVRDRYVELEELVTEARSTLGSAYRAARLMPSWLGADGPRNYLMVLQNNAELRSSGGLPGSVSLIHARDGHVEIVEQEDMANLRGDLHEPVLPLTEDEEALFGEVLGVHGVDATLTPDFVRSASLIRARWEQQMGDRIDGVYFVDPVVVSYLLRGTGAVDVPGYPAVTSGNVVASVENQVYLTTSDRAKHSDYQNAVAKAVFEAFADGQGAPAPVIEGLVSGVNEGRIRVHSFNPEEQREIAGTAIAGEFATTQTDPPSVGVYLNDATQSKMSYYLHFTATGVVRSCTGQVQDIAGSIELRNATPDDVGSLPRTVTGDAPDRTKPGHQRIVIYLMSPVGGSVEELEFDREGGREPGVSRFQGREVATIGVLLEPAERVRIDFVVRTGRGQSGDVDFRVTPGAAPGAASKRLESGC